VEASIFIMKNIDFNQLIADNKEIRNTHVNIGSGMNYSIKELSGIIREIVHFEGKIKWDNSKPEGISQKLLDNTRLNKLG
jgi:GDP-L-fucose synthase